ncbi:MAG TPA: thioredoxin domain-containing protein [Polyangiaceae bacterium]|nr:thioredoxin domain-containing protein [Polyangiaceae bacterium]
MRRAASWGWIALFLSVACAAGPNLPPDQWLRQSALEGPDKGAQSALLPIDADDAVWGNGWAPVTLVAFLDFQCPFCRAAHPTVRGLMQQYGPQKLRVVFKHYPLPSHEGGVRAALVGRAVQDIAGAGAFFVFEDNLYSEEAEHLELSSQLLESHAAKVGVNRERLNTALADPATRERVWRDVVFAERIGVNAVPAFIINGVPIQGALPREYFEQVIEGELQAAADAKAKGVHPAQIYDQRVRANIAALTVPTPTQDAPIPTPTAPAPAAQ